MKILAGKPLIVLLLLLLPLAITAQTTKRKTTKKTTPVSAAKPQPTPEQEINNAPTLTPAFKAFCQAKIKNDETALRKVFSQDTLKTFDANMRKDNVKSLLIYLEDDKVSRKLCEVRNELIQGDTATAEIRFDTVPNGIKVVFVKENGEWKLTNRSPSMQAILKSSPNPATESVTKKNERPERLIEPASGDRGKSNQSGTEAAAKTAVKKDPPVYFYEFTRPGFIYSRVLIEHDEAGRGKISFEKEGFGDLITDPIELSSVTMEKIKGALTALNFLESNENYQYEKDFSNMGNVAITVIKGGRERTAKYNWTENKDAKLLMDEYRRIGSEYTWKFEITIARENQPLMTPGLMDALDSYIQRSEISDPPHLLPFLTALSTDERLPLIARNHATKLIKQLEKVKK